MRELVCFPKLCYCQTSIFVYLTAAYAAAVLFGLSEDSRKQTSVLAGQSGIVRNDVILFIKTYSVQ